MFLRQFLFFFCVSAVTLGLAIGAKNANADERGAIRIHVGGPLLEKKFKASAEELQKITGKTIEVSVSPIDASIIALDRGAIDGLTSGTLPDSAIGSAKQKGFIKSDESEFESFVLSRLVIKIGIHPSNNVAALTKAQLSDIFSGKIKSWESINGSKSPIHVLFGKIYGGVNKAVLETYAGSIANPAVDYVQDKDGLIRALQRDPGAIGFFPSAEIHADFKPVFIDSQASTPLFFVIKKSASPEVHKLYNFLKGKDFAK